MYRSCGYFSLREPKLTLALFIHPHEWIINRLNGEEYFHGKTVDARFEEQVADVERPYDK